MIRSPTVMSTASWHTSTGAALLAVCGEINQILHLAPCSDFRHLPIGESFSFFRRQNVPMVGWNIKANFQPNDITMRTSMRSPHWGLVAVLLALRLVCKTFLALKISKAEMSTSLQERSGLQMIGAGLIGALKFSKITRFFFGNLTKCSTT